MKKSIFSIAAVLLLCLNLLPTLAFAQYTKLHDFEGTLHEGYPYGSLISDGTFLYGMTYYDGVYDLGTIFKILPDGTGYSKLFDFSGTANGSNPYGSLVLEGTFLYGMTVYGGTNEMGAIFKIKTDGTGYFKLLDFAGTANGSYPGGSLISDGTFLYGTTDFGGTYDMGTIFRIKPDGTAYTKLLDFAGTANGRYPRNSLISEGPFLYGMTESGGTNDLGTVFKIKPDGTEYLKLHDFEGAEHGSAPFGSLTSDGTFLYGMTYFGGFNYSGILFKIRSDGTGYSKLLDFSDDGRYPWGSLIYDGIFLYGMTSHGGTNDLGIIFKIKTDGTGYSKLLDFAGIANGRFPHGSLTSDGTFLYGMTSSGGTFNKGTIFKIMPDGTGYSKLSDFISTIDGSSPFGSLISDGTFLYGMTGYGGDYSDGTIFKIKPDGTGYSKLFNFVKATSGSYPHGSLISDGTFLYGMTSSGGTYNYGTIFKIKPDGTGYANFFNFGGTSVGRFPTGDLFSGGTFLYGMTGEGGTNDFGTLFKIKPDGTGYVKLLDFTGTINGSYPRGSLISDGTFLYGMTSSGGINGSGTIFKIKTDGTGYVKLLDFSEISNGSSPMGSLISDGTFLYGMTRHGGIDGMGTIFKIKPDGTSYFKVLDFVYNMNGIGPYGSLIYDGTFLYGMTSFGGTGNCLDGCGVIFKIKPDGTGYSKLLDFTGAANGSSPFGSLISDGTVLYGMTYDGGTNHYGTIFKYKLPCTSVIFSHTKILCAGQSITVGTHTYTTSGNYTDVLTSHQNCDSTVTTHLTVLPAIAFTQTKTVCAGQSITVGTHTYTTSGNYTDVLISYQNCDSTVTTHLTVLPSISFSQTKTICAGENVTVGTHTYSTSGNYTDVLTTSQNCDSIVTTHLTVLPAITFSQTHTLCAGQNIIVGSNTYTSSGNYTDALISYQGCDSTVTTHLTVLPAITFTQTKTICAGQSVIVGTHTYTTSGNFTDVLISHQNCDSTVTTHLTVLPAITYSQTHTLCAGQNIIVGSNTYTSSGNYTDVLISYQGCDSVVTTQLVVNSIDTTVTVLTVILTANASPATYQWINCNNGNTPIAGQTNQSFTASANGNYAVIVTQNNCSDTSSCYNIFITGIVENSIASFIKIYPNPFTFQTTITFSHEQKQTPLKIMDDLGKEIKKLNFTGNQLIIEKGDLPPGIYFLQVTTELGIISKKMIINK